MHKVAMTREFSENTVLNIVNVELYVNDIEHYIFLASVIFFICSVAFFLSLLPWRGAGRFNLDWG